MLRDERHDWREIGQIGSCEGKPFYLPNAVGVQSDGRLVVVDGGNDRLCLHLPDGASVASVGGKGYGEYRFKEPVAVGIGRSDCVYVADWHNHRVVVFDKSLAYLREMGHIGPAGTNRSSVSKALHFARCAAYPGSYIPNHFSPDAASWTPPHRDVRLALECLWGWLRLKGSLARAITELLDEQAVLSKPNGIAEGDRYVYVTEKNRGCVSLFSTQPPYEVCGRLYEPAPGVTFGRLGNITLSPRHGLFVCDECNHTVWWLDMDGQERKRLVGEDSGLGSFRPFSITLIDDESIAVCGGHNFQVLSLQTGGCLFVSGHLGETHGLCYDKGSGRLYLADRAANLVRVFGRHAETSPDSQN